MKIGFHLNINGTKLKVQPEELARYAAHHKLDEIIPGRYSSLFVFNLMNLERVFHIDTTPVLREIKHLEGHSAGLQMKPATEFRGEHLKGLWHQHFLVVHPSTLANNILNHRGKNGLKKLVTKHLPIGETVTSSMIRSLSHAIVNESLEERAEAQKLTGEWIIFAREDETNYYLSIETHQQPDDLVAGNLRVACLPQFPFLSKYLSGK